MTQDQLDQIKKEINRIYLHLIGHTQFYPQVFEVMKWASLADVQKRFEAGEKW